MKMIYLLPGNLIALREPSQIVTILGSCVAVAIYDRVARIAGLNHYLLPDLMPGETPSPRYGTFAIPELIRVIVREGAQSARLEAQVFGGASVLKGVQIGEGIGRMNIATAFRILDRETIPIRGDDVGGNCSRRIVFNTETFESVSQSLDSKSAGGGGRCGTER